MIYQGQLLFTKDGRRFGNAIVISHDKRTGLFSVETDYGVIVDNLPQEEVEEIWHLSRSQEVSAASVVSLYRWRRDREALKRGIQTKAMADIIMEAPDEGPEEDPDCQFDNARASGEGWGLFNGDEIQRLDESETFLNDKDAIAFVREIADMGSEYHAEALRRHKEPDA